MQLLDNRIKRLEFEELRAKKKMDESMRKSLAVEEVKERRMKVGFSFFFTSQDLDEKHQRLEHAAMIEQRR